MDTKTGFKFGWSLRNNEAVKSPTDGSRLIASKTDEQSYWLHFRCEDADRALLQESLQVPEIMIEALLAEEPRPRAVAAAGGLLIILRGVNLNEGAEPEDMISLRIWMTSDLLITMTRRRSRAVQDCRDYLAGGGQVSGTAGCLNILLRNLATRISEVIEVVDEVADQLEEELLQRESYQLRPMIADIRRQAIALRRYLAPQRDALFHLYAESPEWFDPVERSRLRENGDRMMRFVEDLDSLRDRAAVTQEELTSRLSEQMNRTMYMLALITGLFLPLGFVTGLLGINVGGMPGVDNHYAFAIVCGILVLLVVLQYFIFRRLRWIAPRKRTLTSLIQIATNRHCNKRHDNLTEETKP
jgi:zinc transporter